METRDRQVVDKDVETGEWGLAEQIETSARGNIPDDPQMLLQRMEDEQVRQALDRGCDREKVTEVLGITRRTTFNKTKRANAYDFPLGAFSRGGRPTKDTQPDQAASKNDSEDDTQQRLDAVAEQDPDSLGRTETWGSGDATDEKPSLGVNDELGRQGDSTDGTDTEALRAQLQQALNALQEVSEAL